MWHFWKQLVFEDLALRTSDWHLRVSNLRLMTLLCLAFDRTTYQKLIPHHLDDIISYYPGHIKTCFKSGAFTVSIKGRQWHSVALDECHEMCINKDMKSAVVRPTKAYLKKTSLFFGYRIAAHKNLLTQLFPDDEVQDHSDVHSIFDTTPYANETQQNTEAMKTLGKKRMSQKDREHKQVTQCLRRRLAWCNATGWLYNPAHEQYSVYPRAISDCDGNPHGGVKST